VFLVPLKTTARNPLQGFTLLNKRAKEGKEGMFGRTRGEPKKPTPQQK